MTTISTLEISLVAALATGIDGTPTTYLLGLFFKCD